MMLSRKLSQAELLAPPHPPPVGVLNSPVQVTTVAVSDTVPEGGVAASTWPAGSVRMRRSARTDARHACRVEDSTRPESRDDCVAWLMLPFLLWAQGDIASIPPSRRGEWGSGLERSLRLTRRRSVDASHPSESKRLATAPEKR